MGFNSQNPTKTTANWPPQSSRSATSPWCTVWRHHIKPLTPRRPANVRGISWSLVVPIIVYDWMNKPEKTIKAIETQDPAMANRIRRLRLRISWSTWSFIIFLISSNFSSERFSIASSDWWVFFLFSSSIEDKGSDDCRLYNYLSRICRLGVNNNM